MVLTMEQHNSKVQRIKELMRECRQLAIDISVSTMLEHKSIDSWAYPVIKFVDKEMND